MEALCDGCGKCCIHKLGTRIRRGRADQRRLPPAEPPHRHAPPLGYKHRRAYVPECVRLTAGNVRDIDWLPSTCAYRLRAAGEPLRAGII